MRYSLCLFALVVFSTLTLSAQAPPAGTGILLMAHGGSRQWDQQVQEVAAAVNQTAPTEVALGMADRGALQAGIDKLAQRGVKRIVAVPLFVSSHSSVIESLRYLLGLRATAPPELAEFAAMGDMSMKGRRGMGSGHDGSHGAAMQPVNSPVKIAMAPALDHSPILAAILGDRAAAITPEPAKTVVLLVAHGPNNDPANALWLQDMQQVAEQIEHGTHYAGIESLTLRDDAEPAVRDAATARLRQAAEQADAAGMRVVVVPLLLSYGGIENGLRQRLDGIQHAFSPQALLPDTRIAQWVLAAASGS